MNRVHNILYYHRRNPGSQSVDGAFDAHWNHPNAPDVIHRESLAIPLSELNRSSEVIVHWLGL